MMAGVSGPWAAIALITHLSGACASAAAAAHIFQRRERFGSAGMAIATSLALTASWCLAVAFTGAGSIVSSLAETVRNLAWLLVLFRLFAGDGRYATMRPIRWVVATLTVLELLNPALILMADSFALGPGESDTVLEVAVLFRLLLAVGGLVLAHNLYVGAAPPARAALRWPAAALALLWGFDLNLYTTAYLGDELPRELAALRGLAAVGVAILLALGVARDSAELRFRPSRAVAFQTFSLLVIGAYLLIMVAVSRWLALSGGNSARAVQVGFLFTASVVALLVLPSRRLRSWLRVMLAKHLFQHRYDYRAEWLRFTRTIGRGGDDALALEERIVQSLADITDSSAGLLIAPGDSGELALAARWQWPHLEVPSEALPAQAVGFFEKGAYVIDLDDVRRGTSLRDEGHIVPQWLRDEPKAWAMMPLLHYDRLVGVVVLARPSQPRKLDWEDFDLLRVVGQQLASYLAESAVQEALAESSRFDDFHRRIAFVMHDIKNLASQLSLLARNAEHHAENPAFRADMLVTLRNSADKLNTLLARLSRYGNMGVDRLEDVSADEVARAVAEQFQAQHPVQVIECQPCRVSARREALEQVLVHLVQNAVDASAVDSTVFLNVVSDGLHGRIEVIDSGHGMSADFVRSRLFKPFVSSKQGGFGIGAFEARELVRAMQGRVEVESREGLGSRFVIRLPLAAASNILHSFEHDQKVA